MAANGFNEKEIQSDGRRNFLPLLKGHDREEKDTLAERQIKNQGANERFGRNLGLYS